MHRVAVIGGVREETLTQLEEASRDAVIAKAAVALPELGRALASSSFGLLVWSSDDRFIETPIVEGYRSALDAPPDGAILCVYNRQHPVAFDGQEQPAFELKLSPHDDWKVGFYESIREYADGVILIGGGSTTLISGVVASFWGKAVFATPHFYGKAETLHQWLYARPAGALIDDMDLSRMSNQWDPQICIQSLRDQLDRRQCEPPHVVTLRAEVQEQERRALELENLLQQRTSENESLLHQLKTRGARWKATTVLIVALVSFVACAVASDTGWGRSTLVFFALLTSAGIAGAAAHAVLLQSQSRLRIYETAVLGAFSGLFVGVSQALPQVVSTGSVSEFSAAQVYAASIVAVGAGLGFEHAIDRLRSGRASLESQPSGDKDEPAA